ncbi:MAG: hypothetical protein H6667_11205 [Ardenticatenaceae bacterium]|nr:hypothetical protein [Ardenticatenaceae bacterium]
MKPHIFHASGIALLINVIIFLISASAAAYFRRWPLPSDPLEKLKLIANDRAGWTAQAILFPVVYLGTAVTFAFITAKLPATGARWLAITATLLFFAGFLFWLPISIDRLRLGANAAELVQHNNPASPPAIMVNVSGVFWANTLCILAAQALMGIALAWAGVLPVSGWVVAGTAVGSALVGRLAWGDWPPFMRYMILLVIAIGLMHVT